MRKEILILALCLNGAALLAQQKAVNNNRPQDRPGNEQAGSPQGREERMQKAREVLQLDATQNEKWQQAHRARKTANDSLQQKLKGSTTPEERRALHARIRDNNLQFENSVRGFLTPQQTVRFDSLREERRENRPPRGGKQPLRK